MTFQPCPGVAQLVISCAGANDDTWENVLHFGKNDNSAWSDSDLSSLVNSFDTWLGTTPGEHSFLTYLTSAHAITQLLARDLHAQGGPEHGKSVNHSGLDGGTPIASGLSFAITFRTGLSGRNYRGRVFKYGLTSTFQGAFGPDGVDVAKVGDLVSGFSDLITTAAGWTPAMKWGVLSRYLNNAKRANGIITPITSIGYSNLVLDFQRRRAPYHARHN